MSEKESPLSEVWKSNALVGEATAGAQCRLTTYSGNPDETDASPTDEVAIGGAENPACEEGVSMAAVQCSVVTFTADNLCRVWDKLE